MAHARLIRRLERHAEVFAEVHCKIGEVFEHNRVVLRGEFADGAQFVLRQTHPRGIVRIRVNHGADVAFRQITLDFRTQFFTAIVVNIESFVLHALHLQLHFLDGEARVDEQHGVFLWVGLRTSQKRRESALHRTHDGNTTLGGDVDADKRLHEARSLLFQFGIALNVRILRGDAVPKCLDLRLHADLCGRQARNAHLHLDILHARLLFSHRRHLLHLANRRLGKVLNAEVADEAIYYFFPNWSRFHTIL